MYYLVFCIISILSVGYTQTSTYLEQRLMFDRLKMPKSEEQPVTENGINPRTYIIGQGDQFTAYALNSPTVVFNGEVSLESDVFFPEIGLIKVGPLPLKSAKEIINRKLVETLKGKNVEFYISLTKVKSATFTIGGCVLKPGTYTMRGNYRVLDALEKASADSGLFNVPNVNLRDILLIRNDDTISLDLFEYMYKNNLLANPYVYPGQNIYVPYITSKVIISGPIKNGLHGLIPIKKNESLKSILNICIFDESADLNSILIKKAKSSEIIKTEYSKSDMINLEDFDQITIQQKPLYPVFQSVIVKGEVSRPGDYSINNKETKLKHVMVMAGGITNYADTKRACIIRRKNNPAENLANIVNPSVSLSSNPEIQTSIRRMSYFKDYSVLRLKSEDDTILLIEGDLIFIPKKERQVYISGNVSSPGIIDYSENMDVTDCINAAGGLTKSADRSNIYVITVYPENILMMKDSKNIEPGDIIVVPEKIKYKIFSSIIIPILSTVLASISLFWNIYVN